LDRNQKELLSTLDRSASNLLSLLNDVLDFSKFDSGNLTILEDESSLASVFRAVKDNFSHKASEKGLIFVTHLDKNLSGHYLMDATRLIQVLNNLISNAIKFTASGTIELRAESIMHKGNIQSLVIYVRDTGMGIPDEKLPLLFEPFIQADETIAKKFGGTGLGLSICKKIVDAMGGTISVSAMEGIGSQFKVELTLMKADRNFEQTELSSDSSIAAESKVDLSSLQVMCVEDNEVNLAVISSQLNRLGIEHMTAENGIEALNLLAHHNFDVVISDCHMPEMDGYELARTLKQNARDEYLIALTANAQMGSAQECYDAGFDTYLSKPCPMEALQNALREFMFIKEVEQENEVVLPADIESDEQLEPLDELLAGLDEPELNTVEEPFDEEEDKFELDFSHIRDLSGGDSESMLVILNAYMSSNDGEELKAAQLSGDRQRLSQVAHKIKGSLGYLGLSEAESIARMVELEGAEMDEDELQQQVATLLRVIDSTREQVTNVIKGEQTHA
ncbi:ATP-binding protein, partial [Vibrio paucivorans]